MKIMSELTPKREVGEEEMLFFPRYRISVDSAVVPLSTKARPVELEQKICFNLQSKKARSVLSSQSSVKIWG